MQPTYALGVTTFGEPDSFLDTGGGVTRESVVKVADEVVSVVFRQSHEGTTHHYELHFVYTVSQLSQLCLEERANSQWLC